MLKPRTFGLVLVLILLSLAWVNIAQAQDNLGAQIYAENCAVCHGQQGEGRVGATLSKNWPSIRPELFTKSVIEEGVPGSPMPAWGQANGGPLSETDVADIVAYIESWGTTYEPPAPVPQVPVARTTKRTTNKGTTNKRSKTK